MKSMRRQIRELINEHLYLPLTKKTYINSMLQNKSIPQKAKDALQQAVDLGNEEVINSMIQMIIGLTLDPSGKSIYDVEESEFHKYYPNMFHGEMTDTSERYEKTFVQASADRIKRDVDFVLRNLSMKNKRLIYRIVSSWVDPKGKEDPAEVQVGGGRSSNPFGDPWVVISFERLLDLKIAMAELERNGFRIVPQGLPRATKHRFFDSTDAKLYGISFPERTVIVLKDSFTNFQIKVKYK